MFKDIVFCFSTDILKSTYSALSAIRTTGCASKNRKALSKCKICTISSVASPDSDSGLPFSDFVAMYHCYSVPYL